MEDTASTKVEKQSYKDTPLCVINSLYAAHA